MPESEGSTPEVGGEADGARRPSEQFELLLQREQEAVSRADVEALSALQVAKRKLLDELHGEDMSDEVLERIRRTAHLNVTLIRQLVQCMGGLVGAEQGGTYDALGQRDRTSLPNLRGTL